jgi:hypothetical protein
MKQLNTRSHICGGMRSTIILAGALQTLPPLKPLRRDSAARYCNKNAAPAAGALGFLTFVGPREQAMADFKALWFSPDLAVTGGLGHVEKS